MKTFKEYKNIPKADKETGLYVYPEDKSAPHGHADSKSIPPEFFPKIKIIVDSEQSKDQVLKALEYLHYQDIDMDLMAVNGLVHLYLYSDSVEVKPDYEFKYTERNK